MSVEMYTQDQILSGIEIIWREVLDFEESFDPDALFMEQFKDGGLFDEIDFNDVAFRLEREFGFAFSREEWNTFLGLHIQDAKEWERDIAPLLTFRHLADFIREKLKPINFEPLTLLGKPCLTAGIFRGLEQLAEQINPKVKRFAPHTPLRSRLQGTHLRLFWSRLRWMLEDRLPPPPRIALNSWSLRYSLLAKLAAGLLVALWRRNLSGLMEGIGVTFALLIPVGVIVAFINAHLNPLPKEIETFGDLARYLAIVIVDQQSECASCSMP